MDQLEDHEVEILMADVLRMEEEDNLNDELFLFHPLQLMCFENYYVRVLPCSCHGYMLINPHLNVGCNFGSDFYSFIADDFTTRIELVGVYFVSSWAASMFFDFHPVFIDLVVNMERLRGVTINVTQSTLPGFLECVAKMCEAGLLPCHYLRCIDAWPNQNKMYLYTEAWYYDLTQALCEWQRKETTRIGGC